MAIVRCPSCRAKLEVDDAHLGQEVACGECDTPFVARADEPPLRREEEPRPLPRYDDYQEEEDDYDRPRRRRRRRRAVDFEEAEDLVRGPATGLQVVGWIGVVLAILSFLVVPLQLVVFANVPPPPNNAPGQMNPREEAIVDAISAAVQGAIKLVVSIVVLMGAGRMKRLESYSFAMVSSIVALLPCISPCCILGLIFGIMALVALNKPGVKDAFAANRPPED